MQFVAGRGRNQLQADKAFGGSTLSSGGYKAKKDAQITSGCWRAGGLSCNHCHKVGIEASFGELGFPGGHGGATVAFFLLSSFYFFHMESGKR